MSEPSELCARRVAHRACVPGGRTRRRCAADPLLRRPSDARSARPAARRAHAPQCECRFRPNERIASVGPQGAARSAPGTRSAMRASVS